MSRLLFRAEVNASLTSMDVFIFTRDVAVVLPTGWAPEVRRLPRVPLRRSLLLSAV